MSDPANPSGADVVDQIEGLLDGDEPEEMEPGASDMDEGDDYQEGDDNDSFEGDADNLETESSDDADDEDKDDEQEESDDQEASDDDTEEPGFQSIDDLAEALEMSPEDFMAQIKGKIKIDGEEGEVTLQELRDGYQREADYRRKTMELSDARKEFETETSQVKQSLSQQHQTLAQMVQFAEQMLTQDFNGIDWETLQATDPGAYSANVLQFQQRQKQINQLKQQGAQMFGQLSQEQVQQQQGKIAEYINKEADALLDKLPEWKDQEVAKAAKKEAADFLKQNYGFTQEELAGVRDADGNWQKLGITDHRIILLALDAMKARKVSNDVEVARKKVKKLPKLLKPGAKKSAMQTQEAARKQKLNHLKKGGAKVNDVADFLLDQI